MHKELIARLKVGASIERERVVYSGWAHLADEAADAIEELQAENDRIQTELQNSIARRQEQTASADFAVASLKSERDTLRQQLAEAQRDAERLTTQLRTAYGHIKGYYMNTCFECYQSMEFVDKRCHTCAACADKRIEVAAMKGTA